MSKRRFMLDFDAERIVVIEVMKFGSSWSRQTRKKQIIIFLGR